MQYANGEKVKLGDEVKLSEDVGIVVAIISDNLYMDNYQSFSYLENGVLIKFRKYGLFYYDSIEEDVELIGRCNTK